MQLNFLKVISIILLTKIIKIGRAGNNVLSKYKRQTQTSLSKRFIKTAESGNTLVLQEHFKMM